MHETKSKIFGTVLFVVLISCLLYLVLKSNEKTNKGVIKMIEVTGNNLLSENDYLTFTKLNDISLYENLNLPVIKNRFEKHPYVLRSDVELNGNNEVKVKLTEKRILALIFENNEPMFITENFQLLPLLSNTKFVDLPVITNLNTNGKIEAYSKFKNDEMLQAAKIIDAAKLTETKLIKSLTEINMRNGGDVILLFSGIKPPVIFGRGQEAKKMIYLEIMWDSLMNKDNLIEESDYIDLRFSSEIYVGNSQNIGLNE